MSNKVDFNLISNNKFYPIDGRELVIGSFFNEKDFVASDKEDNVYIKHASLLRVFKKLFNITKYEGLVIQSPLKDNDWCATVESVYIIESNNEGKVLHISWSAVADCNTSNSMPGFEKYTTAVAETRASARAIRNILGLDFCSQEEIASEQSDDNISIQNHQKVLIETKFIQEMGIKPEEISKILGRDFISLDNLSKGEAAKLIEKLNSSRRKKNTEKSDDIK